MNIIINILINIALLLIAIITMMIAVVSTSALIMLLALLMSVTVSVIFVQLHTERIIITYNDVISSYCKSSDKMLTRRGLINLVHVTRERIELVNSVLSVIYILVIIVSMCILFAGVYQNGIYFNMMADILTDLGYSPMNVTVVSWSVVILITTAIETYRNKLISRKDRATNIFYAKILS